ncbi:3-hydroxyacyl-CoA dehydrogenase family protein [Streptomyces sp. FXJ1.172]|uniref:3-hydroxyacyl-CoA dehydrogenase family protein n=1 Tax=Streptomyces sp. FXJ1.172 TaxID=710705 RepID=UPI0007CF1642|nr:3-hydroxyacyl-CoA dehydrogenase family protein [Streptomyces sp. FXJ1.172]WEO99626.1 3-hydroxyacyl-CoA dehydrogenase family protein [Streptomyces sp. FXJ1.172]
MAQQRFSTVAVVGLGITGSVFVALLARAGHRVIAVDVDDKALEQGRSRTPGADGIEFTTRFADIARADLVIEAVPERAELKRRILTRAHELCPGDTVFATTTTALSVTTLAFESGRMTKTIGLHLFPMAPDGGAGAVELIATPVTPQALLDDVRDLLHGLGSTAVSGTDSPGFVGGALAMLYLNGAAAMYEQRYATKEGIDAAMTLGCGLPMGPLAQLDAMGLDTAHATLEALYQRTGDRSFAPAPVLAHRVAAGLLGVKSGRGFHDYGGESAGDARAAAPAAPPRGVRTVGVVGSGTMATGIAEVCARSGHPTTLVARSEVKAKEALAAVERSLERQVRRGRRTPGEVAATMARLSGGPAFEALADCDLVVEAVAEDLAVKRGVFAELDRVCRPGAVLATSTSSLPVVECATATGRPQDVLGMHFFNPAPVMKLVEVVRTVLTAEETVSTAHAAAAALGKRPVDCSDRAGFIVNALLFPYLNRAVGMLREGVATADEIDTVMTAGHGFPMGPFQLLDVIGLDVSLAIQRTLHRTFREHSLAPARPLEQLVEAGYLGRKTGRGFRSYAGV